MDLEIKNSFFALRHGKSLANAQRLIISNPESGRDGFGLTQEGKLDVLNNASGILKLVGANPRILTSDFLSARQSAEILAGKAGVEVEINDQLRERRYGDFDQSDDSSYKLVWAEDKLDATHTKWNVESVDDVCKRMSGLVRQLNDEFENEVFVFVSHRDPIQILTTWFKGQPLESHRDRDRVPPGQVQLLHLK